MSDIQSSAMCAAIPEWFRPPAGIDEIRARYGDITVQNHIVTAPANWESDNMIVAHEPWLPLGKLYVNRAVWPMMKAGLEACLAIGDGYMIRTLGCFYPRAKRVDSDLSLHSWGVPFDLNADTNPLQTIDKDGKLGPVICDIPDTWVATLESIGWTWGGKFKGRKDPMHFQFCSGY